MRRASLLFVLSMGLLMSYQNCGRAPQSRVAADQPVYAIDMSDAGVVKTSSSDLLPSASNFRPERSPFLLGAANNNLIWSPAEGAPSLYYLVQYRKAGVQNWIRTSTANTWYTLPSNLSVGVYDAQLTTCHDDLCLQYSETLFTQFQISTQPGDPSTNFVFNLKASYINVQGRIVNRVATEARPNISLYYDSNEDIIFTPQVTGGDGVVECVFRDPSTGQTLGSCLANRTYIFGPNHFPGPWFFEVTIRDNGVSKKRKITFTPL